MLPSIGTLRRLASSLGVSEANLLGDQREIVEEFFHVLTARGVAIPTPEQARRLAEAIADMHTAFGLSPPVVAPDGEAVVATASIVDADDDAGPLLAGPS